ncbi:hypothetical protein [Streptomyces lavendulocolor]|uniref:hypothetical protein n=1 Tax=Streptomyces lavendulocolor TaxID=67316 RepID=UPI00340593D7
MGKIWRAQDYKQFERDAVIGRTYYTVNEHVVTYPGADARTYSAHTVSRMRQWPKWKVVRDRSIRSICLANGPMYEDVRDIPGWPIRNLAGPEPQVALSDLMAEARRLTPKQMDEIDIRNADPRTLRDLEKRLMEIDEANAKKAGRQRGWFAGARR